MVTPVPRAGLKAIFARLANVPLSSVVWKGEPEPSALKPPASIGVTGATNASPIVLTLAQGGLVANGQSLVVSGVGGNTAANATWASVTVVDSTHVSLDGSTGNGAYTSGGTVAPLSAWRNAFMRLNSSSRAQQGWDDNRRTFNADGTSTMKSVGRRLIVLSCDLISFDPVSGSSAVFADDVLEDVRTKIWHPDILDAMNALSCATVDYGSIFPTTPIINGAERSAAHIDFTIALASVDAGVNDQGGSLGVNTWVGEVKGTGTASPDGGGAGISVPFDIKSA